MKVLFIGDVVGESGILYLEQNLLRIKQENKINIVIVNAENITNGRGLKKKDYDRLMRLGVFAITMGNHTFSQSDIKNYINDSKVIRPANFNSNLGDGYKILNYNDKKVCVVNLLGRVYMNNMSLDNPFTVMDNILEDIKGKCDYVIVDIHAEATSEKIAFGLDFDGKVDAVVGTHTHVPTTDERILPKGTLYVTDIGMTGPLNGVLGDDADAIIERFRTGIYTPTPVTKDKAVQFNAVVLDINDNKNSIKRIRDIKE